MMKLTTTLRSIAFSAVALTLGSSQVLAATAEEIVQKTCNACHGTGVMNAPKTGNGADWNPRIKKGIDTLVKNAINGIGMMPAKGANPALSDAEIKAAVEHMVKLAKADSSSAKSTAPAKAAAPAKAEAPKPAAKTAKVNTFNRLMAPPSKRNPPPPEDGIHDPQNDGTHALQPPKEAFNTMPKATSGNRVDWVRSLEDGHINPRWDRTDPGKTPMVLDLNIVREVKGSMPDVVYPHKQHTEWLDCSNCHPAIFIPKKGANQISMASILLGEKCGVCHGKVAFPIAECRKCHSKKKPK